MLFIDRPIIHIFLHFLLPLVIALVFYRQQWKRAFFVMMATMLVDIDHLWATPIYASGRCSIGFHVLHTWPAISVYLLLLIHPKTRLVALGLVIHMLLDGSDCIWMQFEQ